MHTSSFTAPVWCSNLAVPAELLFWPGCFYRTPEAPLVGVTVDVGCTLRSNAAGFFLCPRSLWSARGCVKCSPQLRLLQYCRLGESRLNVPTYCYICTDLAQPIPHCRDVQSIGTCAVAVGVHQPLQRTRVNACAHVSS